MSDVLKQICAAKRKHVAAAKKARPLKVIKQMAKGGPAPRGFAQRLADAVAAGGTGLIAEIKKASPSKGLIREDFAPSALARAFQSGGAMCLSVLTDTPYFQGRDAHLTAARMATDLPVLRKDFILDPYQVYETRAIGADCMLLIMAALTDKRAAELAKLATKLGLDVLVEVHNAKELKRALKFEARLLGINNRNLKTLEVDLATTEELAALVPDDRILIAESGLETPGDLARMAAVGAHCALVGESLMRQADVAAATRALLAQPIAATG